MVCQVKWKKHESATYHRYVEGKDSIDSTIEMLSRETLLDIVKNYLFYREERGGTKVMARYMEYRAANKIVNRVLGMKKVRAVYIVKEY